MFDTIDTIVGFAIKITDSIFQYIDKRNTVLRAFLLPLLKLLAISLIAVSCMLLGLALLLFTRFLVAPGYIVVKISATILVLYLCSVFIEYKSIKKK
jgi:hypothetical protein